MKAHNDYRTGAPYEGSEKGESLTWDAGLARKASDWADELVKRCEETGLLDGGKAGRNVTKVSGAPAPFHYSWGQVVDSWLYEGCTGDFWSASVREQEARFPHFMTASLKPQQTVGCAQSFVKSCPQTGQSLQAFVCQYGEGAPPASRGLYPAHPEAQALCGRGRPFPVAVE